MARPEMVLRDVKSRRCAWHAIPTLSDTDPRVFLFDTVAGDGERLGADRRGPVAVAVSAIGA